MRASFSVDLAGVVRFGRSIGVPLHCFVVFGFSYPPRRTFLEQYKKCRTAAEVKATQEHIIEDLEKSWEESRRQKGIFYFNVRPRREIGMLKNIKDNDTDGEDLLVPNPNHLPPSSDEDDTATESDEEEAEQKPDLVSKPLKM
jgi:pre-rRNA-processing protein TSR3